MDAVAAAGAAAVEMPLLVWSAVAVAVAARAALT
jgi:hypothetical protein